MTNQSDPITKADLLEMKIEIKDEILGSEKRLREEIHTVRDELKDELKTKIQSVRDDIRDGNQKTDKNAAELGKISGGISTAKFLVWIVPVTLGAIIAALTLLIKFFG